MSKTKYKLNTSTCGWAKGTIVTKCEKDPSPLRDRTLVECQVEGFFKHGSKGINSQPEGMWGAWIDNKYLEPYTEDTNNKEKVNMLTAIDVPVGTVYKFHEDAFKERPHLHKGLYVKNTYNSSIMKCNGATIPFNGHQLLPIVIVAEEVEYKESKPTSKVNVIRQRLTISDIEVGETFIVHGKPEVVYVKISNSHCFNLSAMQMHTTTAERFKDLLNIVKVNMVILNGK